MSILISISRPSHIGFTGTQGRLTYDQYKCLEYRLAKLKDEGYNKLHHGDCIGADKAAHEAACVLGMRIHVHPPINGTKRAWCIKGDVVIHDTKDYITRNHDIVDASHILVACPKDMREQLRSGTWATIRYARKMKKQVYIIYPDGSLR